MQWAGGRSLDEYYSRTAFFFNCKQLDTMQKYRDWAIHYTQNNTIVTGEDLMTDEGLLRAFAQFVRHECGHIRAAATRATIPNNFEIIRGAEIEFRDMLAELFINPKTGARLYDEEGVFYQKWTELLGDYHTSDFRERFAEAARLYRSGLLPKEGKEWQAIREFFDERPLDLGLMNWRG